GGAGPSAAGAGGEGWGGWATSSGGIGIVAILGPGRGPADRLIAGSRGPRRAQPDGWPSSAGAFSATARAASAPSATSTRSPASSSTGTPSESALSCLLPAVSPATTKSVFFDTQDATLPPRPVISSLASSLVRFGSVPVSTTVTPARGRASAPSPARSSAKTTPAARHLSTIAACQSTANQSITDAAMV